jgi:lysophospholipase L1-like esterase
MRLRLASWYAVISTLLAIAGCAASSIPSQQVDAAPAGTSRVPVVMILGDSYTTGVYDVSSEATYAAETSRLLGWQVIIGGHSGTGFVAPGRIGRTFSALFDQQLAWRPGPDMIIISGGHNDWPHPATMAGVAARQLLTRIKLHWPTTRIVVLGPLWGGDAPDEGVAVRDEVRAVAKDLRVPFIDPVGERWFTGNRAEGTGNAAQLILPDGTHPTPEGHRYVATRLVADLRRLGLAQPNSADGTDDALVAEESDLP